MSSCVRHLAPARRHLPAPLRIDRAAAVAGAALVLGLTLAPALVAGGFSDGAPGGAPLMAVAGAETPERYTAPVTDRAGVLSDGEASDLTGRIREMSSDSGSMMYLVYVNTFGGMSDDAWGAQAMELNRADNLILVAIAVEDRAYSIRYGGNFQESDARKIGEAMQPFLVDSDWHGAGVAAVDELHHGNDINPTPLLVGGAGAVAVGGGAWAWSRNRKRKRTTAQVADARAIDPRDVGRIGELPIEVLDARSKEELTAADESIRRAQEELNLAREEFGADRTRELSVALDRATETLASAFELRQRLDDNIRESDAERRDMLIAIVSRCGTADDQLTERTEDFRRMREQLLHAPDTLDKLTQRLVDLRSRIPAAEATLTELGGRYDAIVLASIADNADMAAEHTGRAEAAIDQGRGLAARPAGQQGGLVDAILTAETALNEADKLVAGVEHAESRIAEARSRMQALIDEVAGEVTQGEALMRQAAGSGARIDADGLRTAMVQAQAAAESARQRGAVDPLATYSVLLSADAALDRELAEAANTTADFERTKSILDQVLREAAAQIQSADDLVSTRRHIVGGTARTRLAEATRLLQEAHAVADGGDLHAAIRRGQEASKLAQQAQKLARDDIDRHNQQQINRNGGGNTGAFIAGAVLNSMLNSGGGFGGGGFGGGGFSGGGSFGGGGGGGVSGRF